MDATKKWIEHSINAVSAFVDGCHQAGDNAHVAYLRGHLTLGDLRGVLSALESRSSDLALANARIDYLMSPDSSHSPEGREFEMPNAIWLAKFLHETYERLAPQFGYHTRLDTRQFDHESAQGRLMIAVCEELRATMNGAQ